jgi:hypothetical protein
MTQRRHLKADWRADRLQVYARDPVNPFKGEKPVIAALTGLR